MVVRIAQEQCGDLGVRCGRGPVVVFVQAVVTRADDERPVAGVVGGAPLPDHGVVADEDFAEVPVDDLHERAVLGVLDFLVAGEPVADRLFQPVKGVHGEVPHSAHLGLPRGEGVRLGSQPVDQCGVCGPALVPRHAGDHTDRARGTITTRHRRGVGPRRIRISP